MNLKKFKITSSLFNHRNAWKSTLDLTTKEQLATWIVYFKLSIWRQNSDNSYIRGPTTQIYMERRTIAFLINFKDCSLTYSYQERERLRLRALQKVSAGSPRKVLSNMTPKNSAAFCSMPLNRASLLLGNNARGWRSCTRVSSSATSGVMSAGRNRGTWTGTWICHCQLKTIRIPVTRSWRRLTVHWKWRLKISWGLSTLKGIISMSVWYVRKKLMLQKVSIYSHYRISLLSNSTDLLWIGRLFKWSRCTTVYPFLLY